jgi:rubrerythrin
MPNFYECEECGTALNVDSNDNKCPNCGAPINTRPSKIKEKELVTAEHDH